LRGIKVRGLSMHNKKFGLQRSMLSTGFICCLCVLFLALSGCAPLRKKFIRKKKKDQATDSKFIPVLDPIDYPEKIYSAEENYKYHYSLWKVWNKDLLQVIERGGSGKRQKYLIDQSIKQLEEMRDLLNDAKQAGLTELVGKLKGVRQDYDKPSSMRNNFSIRSKIKRNAKKIRNGFSPKLLFSPEE